MFNIQIKNLVIGYNKPMTSPINCTINAGDFIAITGENGAGKTTFINTILGLTNKISGEILFNDISKDEIGFMPQFTSVANDFPTTAHEIVLSGNNPSLLPFYSKDDKLKTDKIMDELSIKDLKNKHFSILSGGQKQRVLLARTLVNPKKVLFIDEPSNNLDNDSTEVMNELLHLINKKGTTVVLISHDERILSNANCSIEFADGSVVIRKQEQNVWY